MLLHQVLQISEVLYIIQKHKPPPRRRADVVSPQKKNTAKLSVLPSHGEAKCAEQKMHPGRFYALHIVVKNAIVCIKRSQYRPNKRQTHPTSSLGAETADIRNASREFGCWCHLKIIDINL